MANWVRVVMAADVAPGTGTEVTVGDRVLAVFNVGGSFHAVDGICSHAGGPLAEGRLEGCVVTCPWHGWQYDVTTGRHCLTEHIRQSVFPAEVRGQEVWVDLG